MRHDVKVKVCGITNAKDALAAVEAGADALGFIFYEKSPRYVVPAVAAGIIAELPPLVTPVGVFVNEGVATVRSIMDSCGIAMAQLHGDEPASYCRELSRPAMKALRLKDRGRLLALAEYKGRGGVRGFVLDTFSEVVYGGTGRIADWNLAAEVAKTTPILLAGGLTPENVMEAIRAVRPYGVDVSSGVESVPGKKDHTKMRAFLEAVRVVSAL
ncbi:MAG TPA: phosphoribosylanthranilate isomerase [Nitrospira sp.]|nr:phosphoribosylanthranilate isomerase [Nitrospira sp.]